MDTLMMDDSIKSTSSPPTPAPASPSALLPSVPSVPSSPLSALSATPSLPSSPVATSLQDASRRYPSPTSTSASGTQSPSNSTTAAATAAAKSAAGKAAGGKPRSRPRAEQTSDAAAEPPAKKRRVASSTTTAAAAAAKERTTEYLDLTKPESEWTADDADQLQRLVTALRRKKKIVVVAGAGISVSAGIPDFRSSTGLFAPAGSQQQKFKASGKHLFDASVYRHNSSTQSFHTMVREMADMASKAKPTPFHHLLASLAQEGRLLRLYSQNIDCIDTSMEPLATAVPLEPRGPWPTTIQLHGGLEKMVCTKCSQLQPFNGALFDGPEPPLCAACKDQDEVRTTFAGKRSHGIGRLRPRFVLYNEFNPDEEAIGNVSSADLKARPDAVLVVGTSLKVPGTRRLVKEMCQVTRGRRDGFTAFVNTDSEPKGAEFRGCWDLVVRAPCDKVAREADFTSWGCNLGDDYLLSPEDSLQSEMRCRETKLEVGIPSKAPTPPTSGADADADADLDSREPEPEPDHAAAKAKAKVKQVDEVQSSAMPTPRPSPKMSATTKAKQTKLPFAAGRDATGKKPRASKPRKPLKTSQPKNTMARVFKAVKGGSELESAAAKAAAGKKPQDPPGDPVTLPSLRPEPKNPADKGTFPAGSPSVEHGSGSVAGRPSTPPPQQLPERPASRDTVSPSSVPKTMRNLIDVQ